MAFTAIAALHQVVHGDIVASQLHFEAQFRMANLTTVPNSVKPVRKDNGAHPLFLGTLV
jgi:hypothetical protein